MPTKKITASTSYQDIFQTPEVGIGRVTSLLMTNKTPSSVNVTVTLEDHFTPDASNAVSSPSATSQEVARMLVGPGLTGSLDKRHLEDIRVLGTLKAICDGTQAQSFINVGYHIEER